MKKVLMLTAKEADLPFILQAQMMGYYVVTTGNAPGQVGHKYADEYVPFDYSDFVGITKMAKEHNIQAVMRGCSDNCAFTAAYICDHLGLKGHDTFEVTEIIHHKDKFKQFAKKYNIKTPQADYYSSEEDALKAMDKYTYPVIVKPNDLAGGQGVSVIREKNDYKQAIEYAFFRSHSHNIVVEPFIEGTLHSLHVFIVDRKVRAYGVANDYSYANKFMTSYGLFPADKWEIAVKVLIPEVERIADILNLADGQMDLQYIMTKENDPWIIEMMRRNPGNHTTGVIANSIGLNWREWIVRSEVGESVKGMPSSHYPQKYYGYYCVMPPRNGVYKGTYIDPEFQKCVIQFEEWEQPGHVISDYLYEKMSIVLFYFEDETMKNDLLPRINQLIRAELK